MYSKLTLVFNTVGDVAERPEMDDTPIWSYHSSGILKHYQGNQGNHMKSRKIKEIKENQGNHMKMKENQGNQGNQ